MTSGSYYSCKVWAFTQPVDSPYANVYSIYTGCRSAVAPQLQLPTSDVKMKGRGLASAT
jgi:hypothetical protein